MVVGAAVLLVVVVVDVVELGAAVVVVAASVHPPTGHAHSLSALATQIQSPSHTGTCGGVVVFAFGLAVVVLRWPVLGLSLAQ